MAKTVYSPALIDELRGLIARAPVSVRPRPARYEAGDRIRVTVTGVFPSVEAEAELRIDKFLGAGYAGQAYRCVLEDLVSQPGQAIAGLEAGGTYAVKIIVPPSRFSRGFRNALYWLAFQGPFSSQVNRAACRAGLLWQKLIRRGGRLVFNRDTAVKDAYASFYDETLGAYGEITEWIEGRTWLLETDPHPNRRRYWKETDPAESSSAEYVAKRQFMHEMVNLLHAMGAPEFARQYEWSTCKSQPNVLKRTDVDESGPAGGLCAIDFRAGLALLWCLPMSPGDLKLIWQGLVRRRTLVQFDRADIPRLEQFIDRNEDLFEDLRPLVGELKTLNEVHRRSLPDITHHGLRLVTEPDLRHDVRCGLIDGYQVAGLVDPNFAETLKKRSGRFTLFYLLGAIPLLGRLVRRCWGNVVYRRHVARCWSSLSYLKAHFAAQNAHTLIRWHRGGRTGEKHVRTALKHPLLLLVERFTLGLLPFPGLHRALAEPSFFPAKVKASFRFMVSFIRDAAFREHWFLEQIHEGEKDGMLPAAEAEVLRTQVREPFIVKYLKCLGVHFATIPVTQIVSLVTGGAVVAWMLVKGYTWEKAAVAFGATLLLFQVTPISPGSLCRGFFVVFLIVKERDVRDYVVAAPLSFVKYLGYLAFPLQAATSYPQLARFMASRWATHAVHVVPVFGERGALLEHGVFDLFFNVPQMIGIWCRPRIRGLLTVWMILGIGLCALVLHYTQWPLAGKAAVNTLIATTVVFVCPRILFYPLMTRGKSGNAKK